MLLGTLAVFKVGKALTRKGVIRAGVGVIWVGQNF